QMRLMCPEIQSHTGRITRSLNQLNAFDNAPRTNPTTRRKVACARVHQFWMCAAIQLNTGLTMLFHSQEKIAPTARTPAMMPSHAGLMALFHSHVASAPIQANTGLMTASH